MERIVWKGRRRPWNLLINRIGATMYRDPALNSAGTIQHFRGIGAVDVCGAVFRFSPAPQSGRRREQQRLLHLGPCPCAVADGERDRMRQARGIAACEHAGDAHHSFDSSEAGKTRWLRRHAAFASPSGRVDPDANAAIAAMGQRLPVLAPEAEVRLLEQAGFEGIELFYAGFTFRGWVGYRP